MSPLTIEGLDVRVAERSGWEDIPHGDISRRFSGRMSSDVTARHRLYRFVTPELETADKLALELMLRSPGPKLCSGDLIGTEAAFHSRVNRVTPVTATDFVIDFTLEETDALTSPLLFSFDGDAPGLYTHTRTGVAYRTNEDGQLESVAGGVARVGAFAHMLDLDGDGVPEVASYLGEPALTTRTHNNIACNVDWSSIFSTWSADAATAPDGTSTADLLIADSGASSLHWTQPAFTQITGFGSDNTNQSWHGWVADGGLPEIRVGILGNDNVFRGVWFDLSGGTIGTADSGAAGYILERVVIGAITWYHVLVIVNIGAGATGPGPQMFMGSGSETATFVGDDVSGVYIWGFQDEINASQGSSWVGPCVSSAITRNADTLYAPWLHSPQVFAAEGATFYTRFREGLAPPFALQAGVSPRIFQVGGDTAAANPRVFMFRVAGGDDYGFQWNHADGTLRQSIVGSGLNPTLGDMIELLGHFNPDGSVQLHASNGGGDVVSGTASSALSLAGITAWAGTRYHINSVGATGAGIAAHISHKAVRGIWTMDQMRSLAAARLWRRAA